jgi:hypothetical protein
MKTPEEAIAKILSDMHEKASFALRMAKDSALQAVTGRPEDKEKNENDAKRYRLKADVWEEAGHIVEFWTTGPGRSQ